MGAETFVCDGCKRTWPVAEIAKYGRDALPLCAECTYGRRRVRRVRRGGFFARLKRGLV